METATSFDVNRAIENWRANLAQSPAFQSDNLYELETHLRDSIATLQRQGLSAEEAFLVTLHRIGKDGVLEAEFAKQNSRSVWLDRALWILLGAQLWLLAGNLSYHFGVFLGFSMNTFGEWMTTYGLEILPESTASSIAFVSMFPLTLVIGAAILFQAHRSAKRRGWDVPAWLLQRPTWLAGTAVFLVLLPTFLNQVVYKLISTTSIERIYRHGFSAGSALVSLAVNTLLLAVVVHLIARRRLRLGKS